MHEEFTASVPAAEPALLATPTCYVVALRGWKLREGGSWSNGQPQVQSTFNSSRSACRTAVSISDSDPFSLKSFNYTGAVGSSINRRGKSRAPCIKRQTSKVSFLTR